MPGDGRDRRLQRPDAAISPTSRSPLSREDLDQPLARERLAADAAAAVRRRPRLSQNARPAGLLQHGGPRRPADLAVGCGGTTTSSTACRSMLAMMAMNYGNQQLQSAQPSRKTPAEVLLFGDRVHQSMSIAGGVIYSLEGKAISEPATQPRRGRPSRFQWGVTPRRTRSNWLTAYQRQRRQGAVDPHRQRRRQGRDQRRRLSRRSRRLRQPAAGPGDRRRHDLAVRPRSRQTARPSGNRICATSRRGALRRGPRSRWPSKAARPISPCGCGVVFAVDAVGGTIRWAIRYQRDGKPNTLMRQSTATPTTSLDLDGLGRRRGDSLRPGAGRHVQRLRQAARPRPPHGRAALGIAPHVARSARAASYCLGVNGRGLFVAGKNVVRRYDIPSGRLVWEKEIERFASAAAA